METHTNTFMLFSNHKGKKTLHICAMMTMEKLDFSNQTDKKIL